MCWSVNAHERIEAQRLILEPLGVDDVDDMVDVMADPALHAVIGGAPPSLSELRERYRQMSVGQSPGGMQQWLNWIIRLRAEDHNPTVAVGTVQATVMRQEPRAEVAWIVGTSSQGKGMGGESARAVVHWLRASGVRYITAHLRAKTALPRPARHGEGRRHLRTA